MVNFDFDDNKINFGTSVKDFQNSKLQKQIKSNGKKKKKKRWPKIEELLKPFLRSLCKVDTLGSYILFFFLHKKSLIQCAKLF